MNDFKMVYVRWRDSIRSDSSWEFIDPDKIKDEPAFCESMGFLVKEGKSVIVIYPHVLVNSNIESCKDQGCGDMTIPVEAIVEMKELFFGTDSVEIPPLTEQKWQGYEIND